MRTRTRQPALRYMVLPFILLVNGLAAHGEVVRLESPRLALEVDTETAHWTLRDRRSGVRWPSNGRASPGQAASLRGEFTHRELVPGRRARLSRRDGTAVVFELIDGGQAISLTYEGEHSADIQALGDALAIQQEEGGYAVVPCREGLLVHADSGKPFRRTFGSSDYEGAHMFMIGLVKSGSALVVSWDDAYTFPELVSSVDAGEPTRQVLSVSLNLRRTARSFRLDPLGPGDWNTVASGYRRIAEDKGLAVTLREKIRRNADAGRLVGAANVKLWTCLARRMNEESTREESVTVRWTFDEAARIAEHLHRDLELERCLFMMGGWTEGGYDCRHPDNLPANPECGGNAALTDAIGRIQDLGYVGCLHDNYQDMYRDAESWDPALIEKRPAGSLVAGGRWLGGRAYMVCAPKQLELARRPQNLPGIHEIFPVQSYFIDTTYAVGPRECHDPAHPVDRNEDIAWKIRLSDYARDVFGLFGSECGREWALPHSDFFEGLVGVSGRYYHNLDPADLGATPIPLWEMVYHDCQIAWGKYGYAAERAADYVAHHVLCARPLHYHSIPDHLYWKSDATASRELDLRPRVVSVEDAGEGTLRIHYVWDVKSDVSAEWRIFVHFGTDGDILFQDDHAPGPPTPKWKQGDSIEVGPHTVRLPRSLNAAAVEVYMGLFDPASDRRARLRGADRQRRIRVGRLRLEPEIAFEPVETAEFTASRPRADAAAYLRSDGGWAEGLHPVDIFLKNTQEVLGPLHAETAHAVLSRFEFSTPDRAVRRAVYGEGEDATTVTVNFGETDHELESPLGGRVVLPPWGFVVEGPSFAAFHARRWGGQAYPEAALFTLRSLDGRRLLDSRRVRIYHGFGEPSIRWKGSTLEVRREQTVVANGERP